jgi:hypothetical protein
MSPIKGLERLSEELRLERQKANYALQEKARIRVEIESYKQTIEQQKETIDELQQKCDGLVTEVHELEKQVQSAHSENSQSQHILQQSKSNTNELQSALEQANATIENYRQKVLDRDNDVHELRIRMETLEKKGHTKDDLIQSLKDELLSVRKSQMTFEEEKEQVYSRLNQQSAINQELQAQLQLIGAKESGYHETVESNAELRDALEKTLLLNNALHDQVQDLQSHLNEKTTHERSLLQESMQLHSMRTQLLEEISNLQVAHDDTVSRLDAEIDAKLAAQEKAEAAVKNRVFLESQMSTMRSAYEDALSASADLEREIATQKQMIADLQEQMIQLRDKEAQLETLQRQVTNQQAVSLELETLRTQLQVMRKKLVKKDLEEEAQVVAPRALLEREQQGRLVYEGIIADLRKEVDRVTSLYHDSVRRCDDLTLQASRADALQEEIELYKETAKAISQESQTMALTASEVAERSVKATHERHSMLQALQSSQTALHSAQAEVDRMKSEILELKDKVKQYHAAKLQADKRVTEISAINARLEASMETFQQQFDNQTIALEESKRQLQDLQRQYADFQRYHADCDHMKKEFESLKLQTHFTGQDNSSKMMDMERLLEAKQVEKELLQSEVTSLKDKLTVQKQTVDHLQQELLVARRNYDEAHLQCERYRLDSENSARTAQHKEIVSLQDELRRTMQEWSALEVEQGAKDNLIEQLRVDYGREKERAILLKMQVSLLEEKLQVVTQELQVYRGIDVYHATRQSELLTTSNLNQVQRLKEADAAKGEAEKKKGDGEGRDDEEDEDDDSDFFGRPKSLRPASATLPSSSSHQSFNHWNRTNATASPLRKSSRLSLAEITSVPPTTVTTSSTSSKINPASVPSKMPVNSSSAVARRTSQNESSAEDDYFFGNGKELRSKLSAPSSPSYSRRSTSLVEKESRLDNSPSSSRYFQRSHLPGSAARSSYAIVGDNSHSLAASSAKASIGSPPRSAADDLLARAELMRERQMRRLERERALRVQILSEEKSSQRLGTSLGFSTVSSSAFRSPMPLSSSSLPSSLSQHPSTGVSATNGAALTSATRSTRMDLERARRTLAT